MEVKNGIIIDGVLHEAVQYKINCKRCSLLSVCHEFNAVCAVIGCEAFVERGKVTVTSYYRETPKNAGEIIKNRKGGITMGFTTPCFIRKNTPELRDKLVRLGYKIGYERYINDDFLATDNDEMFGIDVPYPPEQCNGYIHCGTNEALFLAIAALRDDTDENQWFIADSPLSVSYDDIVGNDHYFVADEGSVFFWDINWRHATIISGNYHKATVEELIEHFKGKEE